MTVSSTINREQYATNGATTAFTIHFPFFEDTDVNAAFVDVDGSVTTLALNTDFTVTGGSGSGGTLTTAGALSPLANGGSLTIYREIPFTQEDDYVEDDPLPADTLEGGFDRAVMRDQQLKDGQNRSLTQPVTDSTQISPLPAEDDRASMLLGFDGSGQPIAVDPAGVSSTGNIVSAFIATVLDDTSQSAALATLGLPIFPAQAATASGIQAAIDAAVANGGGRVQLPVNTTITLTSEVTHDSGVPVIIEGAGHRNTILKTASTLTALLVLGASSVGLMVRDVGFDTTGANTACVSITAGAQQATFTDCRFKGDRTGDLVLSRGQFITFVRPVATGDATGTVPFHFDGFNQQSKIDGGRVGGICNTGVLIDNATSGSAPDRPQGVILQGSLGITNTGTQSVKIGESYETRIVNCSLDQASTRGVYCTTNADRVSVVDSYLGAPSANTTWIGVYLDSDAGSAFKIQGNRFNGGGKHIASIAAASAGANNDGLLIIGNQFEGAATATLDLDSVTNCKVIGNTDKGTPSSGSWVTRATNSANGSYFFDGNSWHTTTPAVFATAATYQWGCDSGIVMRNTGSISASSTTSASGAHGMSRTPARCIGTPDANAGNFWNSVKNGTNVGFTWSTSGSPNIAWEAWV